MFHDGWHDRTAARRGCDLHITGRPDSPEVTRRCRPACAAPKPVGRNRSRERTARIARIRNRNRYRDILTRPIVDSKALVGGRSPAATTVTECARCCSSSKAGPAPAHTAPGSTTRSNPKSYHPSSGRHPNHRRDQRIRRSDQQSTSTYTVLAVTVVTMSFIAQVRPNPSACRSGPAARRSPHIGPAEPCELVQDHVKTLSLQAI